MCLLVYRTLPTYALVFFIVFLVALKAVVHPAPNKLLYFQSQTPLT